MFSKQPARGKVVKMYRCSNVRVKTEDGECWEHVGTCSFTIWSSSVWKYGGTLSHSQVREMLEDGQTILTLRARHTKNEYRKYAIPDQEYGIKILFDTDVSVE